MIDRYENGSLFWVDLSKPSEEELTLIRDEFGLSPTLSFDLGAPVPASKVECFDDAAKLTLDFPLVKHRDIESPHEIKFIILKKALISIHYDDIPALHQFAKEFEVLSILNRTGKHAHGGHLFVALMSVLYESLSAKLDYFESRLENIEQEIFNEREREMVFETSKMSRKVIAFRHALWPHEDILHEAHTFCESFFSKDFPTQCEILLDKYRHLMRRVHSISESIDELRDTTSILVNTKQNEVIKTLTVMAFIALPLTLFSSIFGMNVTHSPFNGQRYDFWIIVGLMGLAGICFFLYFKYKKKWF